MLVGTADPALLARGAARLEDFGGEPLELVDCEVFQSLFEMRSDARESLLPPGLHPTNPATLAVLVWRCATSPWGPFALCQLRVGCRSGVRTRGLALACACDQPEAARALGARWGFAPRPAAIALRRRYDRTSLRVDLDGAALLDLVGVDPEPLAPDDIQFTGTLTLAETERGLRLIQVEPGYALADAERLRPRLERFDAEGWGVPALAPYHPVSASIAAGCITLPPIRFVCRPDVGAFEGTERVG